MNRAQRVWMLAALIVAANLGASESPKQPQAKPEGAEQPRAKLEKAVYDFFKSEIKDEYPAHVRSYTIANARVTAVKTVSYCPLRTALCGTNPTCGHPKRKVTTLDLQVGKTAFSSAPAKLPKEFKNHLAFHPLDVKVGDTVFVSIYTYAQGRSKISKIKKTGGRLVITAKNSKGQKGLTRLNKFTHIYSFNNDRVWIQFSFDAPPFDAEDPLAAVRKHFKYCTLEVRFPDRKTDNSRSYTQLRGPLRILGKAKDFQNMSGVKLAFEGFEGGRLKGKIEGTVTKLTTRTEGPNLRTGDIAGVGHSDEAAKIPFLVEFDLSVRTESPSGSAGSGSSRPKN